MTTPDWMRDANEQMRREVMGTTPPDTGAERATDMRIDHLMSGEPPALPDDSAAQVSTVLAAINRACEIIELGDQRLLASDGPAGNQPPHLSLQEWREMYSVLDAARTPTTAQPSAPALTEDRKRCSYCGHDFTLADIQFCDDCTIPPGTALPKQPSTLTEDVRGALLQCLTVAAEEGRWLSADGRNKNIRVVRDWLALS